MLINKNYLDEGDPINTTCQYCDRWATHPNRENTSNQSEYVWKKIEELDGLEMREVQKALKNPRYISHGICPYCYEVINSLSMSDWGNKEKIKGMSLEMI